MKGSKPTYKTPRDLPLYTAVYRLLEQVDEMMNNFKRDRKHTLGQNIYNTTLDLFECIRVANDFPKERERALLELLGKYDRIATMIKFANEHYYIKMNYRFS